LQSHGARETGYLLDSKHRRLIAMGV